MDMTRGTSDKDVVSLAQRVAEPTFAMIGMSLALGFFVYHQAAHTGFFTGNFGPFEMLCFYGPIILSPTASIVRAATGRRNVGRPFEVVVNTCTALAALWLLNVFPFDFTHFADALPGGLQIALAWVNDFFGRIALMLQVAIGAIAALAYLGTFLVVSWRTRTGSSTPLIS